MTFLFFYFKVRKLYKTILKLHRGLPADLAYMGNMYVKDEFKRHKLATPEQTIIFMENWAVSNRINAKLRALTKYAFWSKGE